MHIRHGIIFIRLTKIILTVLLSFCILMSGDLAFAADDPEHSNTSSDTFCKQVESQRKIELSFDDTVSADTVEVTAHMPYKGQDMHTLSKEFAVTGSDASINVPYYGRWEVSIKYMKDGNEVKRCATEVGVTAKKYNIAPLMSSVPVLIFSIKLLNGDIITQEENGSEVPSVVTLARSDQYDWDDLPDGVYDNPYITEMGSVNSLYQYKDAIVDYVKSLAELDPDSHFTFFFNDYHMDQVLPELVYQTGIKDGNYSIRFLTDGADVSYTAFRDAYDNIEDAPKVHEQKKQEFKVMRNTLRNGGHLTDAQLSSFYTYIYAIIDVEEDAEWWVIRKSKDTFGRMLDESGVSYGITDMDFFTSFLADTRITNNYINNLLARAETNGNSDKLKELYKFDDSVYAEIEAEGKKPMMILGTSYGVEWIDPIDEYVRIMKAYYGDEYAYIYKGHPGNIPSEKRVAELEELGMKVVDASIAAELFLFFRPETSIAGYPSTTFQSVGSNKTAALFFLPKNEAYSSTDKMWTAVQQYASNADFMVSKVDLIGGEYSVGRAARLTSAEINNNAIRKLADIDFACASYVTQHDGHSFYLLEFTDDAKKPALWDAIEHKLIYPAADAVQGDMQESSGTYQDGEHKDAANQSGKQMDASNQSGEHKDATDKVEARNALKTNASVRPKGTKILRIKIGKRSFIVKWKKQGAKLSNKRITGYQVQYSTSKKFKNARKTITVKGYKKVRKKIKKLKSRKKYYVRIRTYQINSGKKLYSPWSKAKSVKTK